nr:MAG TPA: hypothetical protein [Bacteriophage sp.]
MYTGASKSIPYSSASFFCFSICSLYKSDHTGCSNI